MTIIPLSDYKLVPPVPCAVYQGEPRDTADAMQAAVVAMYERKYHQEPETVYVLPGRYYYLPTPTGAETHSEWSKL